MLEINGILELAKQSRGRIGIGAKSESDVVTKCVKEAKSRGLPDVVVYGDGETLCRDLRDRKICAAVRGTLSSSDVLASIKKTYSVEKVLRIALLSTANGKPFFLAPIGIDEGNNFEERSELMRQGVRYLKCLGVTPKLAILSRGRSEDGHRGDEIARSLEEGERLREAAASQGLEAVHAQILIERAVQEADFVIAPDGVSGNLIFRTLYFLGSGGAIGAPVVNIGRVFVDTSRDKRSYVDSISLAAALCYARERRR